MTGKRICVLFCMSWFLLSPAAPATGSDTEKRIEKPVRQAIDTRQGTQKAEAQWRIDKEKLTARFEQLQAEQVQLQQQKDDLGREVESTRARIAAKEKQLADIEQISSQIEPFLEELVEAVKVEVSDGLPFLMVERQRRIDNLDRLMATPDISVSEKYRKAMEALLVEAEYGFTIETYQETIAIDNQARLASIFRLGRIGLFFQSLDQKLCGFYNVATGGWQALPASHNPAIHDAIEIAAKRKPVELLSLPVGRMVAR